MSLRKVFLILLLVSAHFGPLAGAARSAAPEPEPEPRYQVRVEHATWHDSTRHRTLPVKIHRPVTDDRLPVVVFSTGLGESREGCGWLGRYWARRGYVAVHVQHPGSDHHLMSGLVRSRRRLSAAFEAPANGWHRAEDLRFIIDQLHAERRSGTALGEQLDLNRLGVAGCDFGAQTALALGGQMLPGRRRMPDHRVRAVVALSAPIPLGKVPLAAAYSQICIPCLFLTGTEDDGIIGSTTAAQRRLAFDHALGAERYLVTLRGADHMIYRGHQYRRRIARRDPMYQALICRATTLFWEQHLADREQTTAARTLAPASTRASESLLPVAVRPKSGDLAERLRAATRGMARVEHRQASPRPHASSGRDALAAE